MIIVAVTDIHGSPERLSAIADDLHAADVVLLTGDLTHFGHREEAERVLQAARSHADRLFAIAGNCDHGDVEDYMVEQGVDLHGRCRVVDGVAFIGLGGSLPCPFRTPNERTEGRMQALLRAAAREAEPGLPLVLVSHQPPLNTAVDVAHGGRHVGSTSVRRFIEEYQPLGCFTGHIHEGRGVDSIGPTQIVNPGPLRAGGYAYAEIDSGGVRLELRGVR